MIRITAKEHSSGDVTQRFVFRVAVDDTSDFVSKRRVFKSLCWDKSEQGVVRGIRWFRSISSTKNWITRWWGESWRVDINWPSWKESYKSWWKSQEGFVKILWQDEEIIVQDFSEVVESCGRLRRWNAVSQEVFLCDVEGCGNQHVEFNITPFLFEVVHDVEGGRTRAVCSRCSEKDNVFRKISIITLRFVQAQRSINRWKNITFDEHGDADMFSCEFLHNNCRK